MNNSATRLAAAALCLLFCLPACNASSGGRDSESGRSSPAAPAGDRTRKNPPTLILTPVAPPPAPGSPQTASRPRTAPPRTPGPASGVVAPPPAPAVVPPTPARAGTFLFGETGLTRIRGCLTLDQPPPSPTKLIVAPQAGDRQHLDRDQRDPLGAGSTTAIDVEYRPDGIYLVNLRQTQTSLLSSQPTEFRPSPPVLLLPAAPLNGQSWSFSLTSTDGGVKIDSQNRVESLSEPVTLGNGQVVQTRRILAESRITGQSTQGTLDLSRTMTTWYAPESGLPVKEVTDMKGRVGLCEIDSHTEATLQSL